MVFLDDKQKHLRALQIIDWVCAESICGEFLNTVEIPENDKDDSQEEWLWGFFGGCTPCEIDGGGYLYYWLSDVGGCVRDRRGNCYEPDAEIEINGGDDYIYLYRLT